MISLKDPDSACGVVGVSSLLFPAYNTPYPLRLPLGGLSFRSGIPGPGPRSLLSGLRHRLRYLRAVSRQPGPELF